MSEWQPIETAPTDLHAEAIVYCRGTLHHAYRSDEGNFSWWDKGEDYALVPTHWMPLPEPPQVTHEQ